MRTLPIILTITIASLVGCSKSTSPPSAAAKPSEVARPVDAAGPAATVAATSAGAVTLKLQELAGSNASDCGRVTPQVPEHTLRASDCAMEDAKAKKAFYVAYEMPGLIVGYAGNSQGKMFSIQSEQPENPSAKAEVKVVPCPAELRVAQSGRVTCMKPTAMPPGANPHGGMMPATGASPHGGIAMPNLGTSHPPAKTPPKQ